MGTEPDIELPGTLDELRCPACSQPTLELGAVPMRDFDGALFNREGRYRYCQFCGMARVEYGLSDGEIAEYYAKESLYSVLSGVGVGGDTPEDTARYRYYLSFMRRHELAGGLFADIGCSRGGFVRFLADESPNIVSVGVDCDERSLSCLEAAGMDARAGDVFALPLADGEVDALSYFHVLEHLYDINAALAEAARVLKPGGALLAEVPDASRYFSSETNVGPMFWLALKEHLNHFSPAALVRVLVRNGFEVVAVDRTAQPMKGDTAYPSLLALAKKRVAGSGEDAKHFDLDGDFSAGFAHDTQRMRQFAEEVAALPAGPIAFWGMGLEFFALYGYLAPLLKGRQVRFMDSNPSKQILTVDGNPVMDPAAAPVEGELVCCSYMAAAQIIEQAVALGWDRRAIKSLA